MDRKKTRRRYGTPQRIAQNKRTEVSRTGTVKVILCGVILLTGVVIKFGFDGSQLHQSLSQAIHGSVDYRQAAAALGRAVSGEEDIVSVFKEITQAPVQEVYGDVEASETEEIIDEDFYNAVSEPEKKSEKESLGVAQLDFLSEQARIEELSFEMSEAELSDDTKAEPFVIPPPANCSYEKVEINFRYAAPVYGKITSPYGYRDHPVGGDAGFHTGMDIAASMGTAVKAFGDGKVIQAGTNKVYGNFVLIEHADGIRSFYGHNSKLCVKTGAKVKLGQKIAEVGSTGLSTGPHVHFEVRKGNLRLNPKHYISPESI